MKTRPTFHPLAGLALVAAFLLSGCASRFSMVAEDASTLDPSAPAKQASQPFDSMPRNLLARRSLAVRTGSTPNFYADTPGRRTFGLLGVVAMMREGNRLVKDFGLRDPANQLSASLAASLTSHNGMRTGTPDSADLLLDVRTINWDFRPYRNDPDNLYVVYAARVSLVDQRSGSVLAAGKCRSRRDAEGDSATLDQLLAEGARRLQNELREAAEECAQRVRSGTFSALLENVPAVAQQWKLPEPPGFIR
jgi:hypothetical protein